MTDSTNNRPLRRVGVLWKPRAGARSLGSGNVTVNGLRQRFVILRNERKWKATDPDFLLMSSDEPKHDAYVNRSPSQGRSAVGHDVDDRGDIPF